MRIGVPKEIKSQEHRVGLVPASVRELVDHGHKVSIETQAGAGIGFSDSDYKQAGAKIVKTAAEIFDKSEMVIKVKEPQPQECKMLSEGQILFTYLHLAPDPEQAKALVKSKCVAIAYETVTGKGGKGLPLLAPMSEVAGRLSTQMGAHYLQKHLKGLGRLIGGVPGVEPANVLVLGGGVAGFNAARMAVGMEANVTLLERSPDRMRELDDYFAGRAQILYSTNDAIAKYVQEADIVIGAVLIPGASAPRLVTKAMLKTMKKGAILVDIAIDQGGCFETSKPTTHENPVYEVDGITHYCVANMPGAVPLTSALALNNAVLPYAIRLANQGWRKVLAEDADFRNGLNVCFGKITHKDVAQALKMDYIENPSEMTA